MFHSSHILSTHSDSNSTSLSSGAFRLHFYLVEDESCHGMLISGSNSPGKSALIVEVGQALSDSGRQGWDDVAILIGTTSRTVTNTHFLGTILRVLGTGHILAEAALDLGLADFFLLL
jgi:hypothetical protein